MLHALAQTDLYSGMRVWSVRELMSLRARERQWER